jgi:hypothetical protein
MAANEVTLAVPQSASVALLDKKESSTTIDLASHIDASNPFDVSPEELQSLIDPHKDPVKLTKLGGAQAILKALHVNPLTGIADLPGEIDEGSVPGATPKHSRHSLINPSESKIQLTGDASEGLLTKAVRRKVFGKNVLPELRRKNIFDCECQ